MTTLVVSTTSPTVKLSGAILTPHYCEQCGKDMGYEWLLGAVCGKCCRANHRQACHRNGSYFK